MSICYGFPLSTKTGENNKCFPVVRRELVLIQERPLSVKKPSKQNVAD